MSATYSQMFQEKKETEREDNADVIKVMRLVSGEEGARGFTVLFVQLPAVIMSTLKT